MKFCPQCGSPFEPQARFCQECGFDAMTVESGSEVQASPDQTDVGVSEVSDVQENSESLSESRPPKHNCPQCGNALGHEERFCPECGYDTATMPKEPAMVVPPAVPEVISAPPVQQADGQYCPNCGAMVASGDLFCQECGYKMTDVVETATGIGVKHDTIVPPPVVPVGEKTVHTPPVAAQASPPAAVPPRPVVLQAGKPGKSRKGILVVLLALLGLAVLGAGGWYVYTHYISTPGTEIAETPPAETAPDFPVTEPEVILPAEDSASGELPEEEPVVKEPEKKATPPRKTTPKKPADTPKPKAVQEEPVKKDEPLKVVVKNTAASKSPRTLYNTFNTEPVKGKPPFANKVKFEKAMIVTRIITFHYNEGSGAPAGTITLEGRKKDTGGPWQARNAPGSDGMPNEKWICEPNARLEAGTYKVVVSDEKSWSFNTKSGRKGMVIIEGYEAD